jgi:hypothetical protein
MGKLFIILLLASTVSWGKIAPDFEGIDPRAKAIHDNYIKLAKEHNIKFKKKVSIGFGHFNKSNVIGMCYYGSFFREIVVDIDFWNKSSKTSNKTLLFHELNHAYCDRDHDWAKDKRYPAQIDKYAGDGYFKDYCPKSIMHSELVFDICISKHRKHYLNEMFERCKPY